MYQIDEVISLFLSVSEKFSSSKVNDTSVSEAQSFHKL